MLNECPHCGQRLRTQWVRCPRCRQLIPQDSETAAAETTTAPKGSHGRWIVVASVAAIALAIVFVATRGRQPSPAVQNPVAASPTADVTSAGGEATSVDLSEDTPPISFEAIGSKRSAAAAYSAGDFAAALAALEAAVVASPHDAEARNNLGQLLVRQGRSADALPHFDEAVRLDGARWQYRFNRARAYGLLNRWPEAVAEYRIAAEKFPDDHATLYNLGLAQLRVRDYTGAAASLERAVAVAPEQHDFLITLGTAYVGAAQNDRARAVFERFLEVAPDDAEAAKVKSLLQALAESAP